MPFVIIGLASGALYGLAGLGLVLTYRTSGVFNFGHGAIAAGGAFLFYTLHVTYGWAWPLAAVATMVVFGTVVAVVLERITRGLSDVPGAVVVVATLGLWLGIQGLLFKLYGNSTRHFEAFLPTSGFTVSGVNVSWADVITIALATASAAGLYLFLRSSRLGVAMRAVVDDPTLVRLTGQRPNRVRIAAWSIGCTFAALSGILLAPTLGLDATLLTLLVVQAFGAAAIGLFASLPMTYLGGFVVGVTASIATRYLTTLPWSGLPPTVPFLVLIAVLLVVPTRKLPVQRVSLRNLVPEFAPMSAAQTAALWTVAGVALLIVPHVVGTHLSVWISAGCYAVLFGSLALLVWVSGQISACHMAFAALGATTMSHLAGHLPWLVALVAAGLLTIPIGALVAVPAIRLPGIYLALITLGFGILMQNVLFRTSWMFGSGLIVYSRRPQLGFVDGTSDTWLYHIVLACAAATMLVLAAVYRGRLGRLLRAMSETPTMLATHGLEVGITRLLVFCLSAFLAGIAGALMVTQSGSVAALAFGPIQSLQLLTVLAVCGTRLQRSSLLAAALIAIVPGYVTGFGSDDQVLAFGVLAVVAALLIAHRSQITAWVGAAASSGASRRGHSPTADRQARALRNRPRVASAVASAANGTSP